MSKSSTSLSSLFRFLFEACGDSFLLDDGCDSSSTLLDLLACDDSSTDDSSTLLDLLGDGDDVSWWLSQLLHVRPRNHNTGKLIAIAEMSIPVFKVSHVLNNRVVGWYNNFRCHFQVCITSKQQNTYKLHSY